MFHPRLAAIPDLGLLLLVCLIGSGCAPGAWEAAYRPAPIGLRAIDGGALAAAPAEATATAPSEDGEIVLHAIPWARMESVLDVEVQVRAGMAATPAAWTPARNRAHRQRLLRGLEFSGDHQRTAVLGRVAFRRVGRIEPLGRDRTALLRQARSVGATDVVVAWSDYGTTRLAQATFETMPSTEAGDSTTGAGLNEPNGTPPATGEQDAAAAFFLRVIARPDPATLIEAIPPTVDGPPRAVPRTGSSRG